MNTLKKSLLMKRDQVKTSLRKSNQGSKTTSTQNILSVPKLIAITVLYLQLDFMKIAPYEIYVFQGFDHGFTSGTMDLMAIPTPVRISLVQHI